jgi:cysteine-rich repeat protein
VLRVRFQLSPDEADPRAPRRRGGPLLGVGLVAALATGAVLAGNAISGTSGGSASTIYACAAKKTGAVRIVTQRKRCKRTEKRVTWNRVGRAGIDGLPGAPGGPGAPGAPGAAGANGAQGPPGIDAFNDLDGMPCTRSGQQGEIDLTFDSGVARTRCRLPSDGAICGDGVQEGGEACDDGNDNPGDSCTNTCTVASCGDGVVRPSSEQCDSGGSDSATCDGNSCTAAYCGDGHTNMAAGEACDLAGGESNVCDDDCTPTSCGDGHENRVTEDCDDGNFNNTDACPNSCQLP